MKFIVLLAVFCFSMLAVTAQDLKQKVTINFENVSLEEALRKLESDYGITFSYVTNLIEVESPVTLSATDITLEKAIRKLLGPTSLAYKPLQGTIVIKSRLDVEGQRGWIIPEELPGDRFTLSGYIRDLSTGEDLIGAIAQVENELLGTAANHYGFYSLTLPEGKYRIVFSYLGYEQLIREIDLTLDQRIDLLLKPAPESLREFSVSEDNDQDVFGMEADLTRMPMRQVGQVPALMGNQDILVGVQSIPGIQSKTEGSTGFYVRGGNQDQNLILMDEAPVYNEAHFLGFLSVFNWNTIKSAELYKDGIPAQYGGRLSSVLDLRMKEGNMQTFSGSGEVNPLFAQLTLEAPIVKDKASVLVSGRRSTADVFFLPQIEDHYNIQNFHFTDLNVKTNWKASKNDRLYLSGYLGNDVFQTEQGFFQDQRWGNTTGTLRWNRLLGDRLFANFSGIFSRYYYLSSEEYQGSDYYLTMSIRDWTGKADFGWYPSENHTVRFGVSSTVHSFAPGDEQFTDIDTIESYTELPIQDAIESGFYVSDDWQISKRLKLYAGFRLSLFQNVGEASIVSFDDRGKPVDTTFYYGGTWNQEWGPEPRLKLGYRVGETGLVNVSYDRTYQYLHLASNTLTKAPTDIWIPTTPNVRPQLADQVSVGYLQLAHKGMFQFVGAVYHKQIQNAVDFRESANLVLNERVEADLKQGYAWSEGIELAARKLKGRLSGAVTYTLSRTEMQVDGINSGDLYTATYDRPHNLGVWANYKWRRRWMFSFNFVLQSGLPANFPEATYAVGGETFVSYGPKNSDRLPTYHRLDLAVVLMGNTARKFHGDWTFSVYNVYNRYNAYTIVFDGENAADDGNGSTPDDGSNATLYYVFPIMPSVSYAFKF